MCFHWLQTLDPSKVLRTFRGLFIFGWVGKRAGEEKVVAVLGKALFNWRGYDPAVVIRVSACGCGDGSVGRVFTL